MVAEGAQKSRDIKRREESTVGTEIGHDWKMKRVGLCYSVWDGVLPHYSTTTRKRV